MGKTLIVVNPRAREGAVRERWAELEPELMAALGDAAGRPRVVFTTEQDHGAGAVREGLRDGVRRVVVVGGDGTISQAIQGFFECGRTIAPDASLAVMPAGRGDDFFKSLVGRNFSSSRDAWERGLGLLRQGSARATDVGRVRMRTLQGETAERYFINIASVGYPGLVVQRVQAKAGLWGRSRVGKSAWTYLAQSLGALREYRPIQARVQVDGKSVFEGELFSAFVLNGWFNAGGVRWSPDASLDDGLFDLLLMRPRGLWQTLTSGSRMLSGDWEGAEGVTRLTGTSVEIDDLDAADRAHPLLEVDGDLIEPPLTEHASFELLPKAIRICRP